MYSQISYLRTANGKELTQALYAVMAVSGRILQLLKLAVFRKDIRRLLADIQQFVNISNISIVYNFSSCYYVVYISTEDTSSTIYGITDAKVSFYCKIYERLIFVSVALYVAAPAILEFQATQRTIENTDVGFFYDL